MSSNAIYYMTLHGKIYPTIIDVFYYDLLHDFLYKNVANDNRFLLIRFITQLSMVKYSQ